MRKDKCLWLLLGGELIVMTSIAMLGDLRHHIPLYLLLYGLSTALCIVAAVSAMRARISMRIVILAAIVLRVPMFFTQPTLSDDVWRYLHDGRAQIAGVSPYAFAPNDPRTAPYRGPEFERINHPDIRTIYPPIAQIGFRAAAMFSAPLLAWRLIQLFCEIAFLLVAARFLAGRGSNVANLALYAWHPLAIIESIGSAHLEPLGIALLVTALAAAANARWTRAGIALAASVAAKLVAAPLVLMMNRRTVLAFGLTLIAIIGFGFQAGNPLGTMALFASTWESNGSVYGLATALIDPRLYRVFAAGALLGVLWWVRDGRRDLMTSAAAYFFALFLLAPVVHPWYLLWLLAIVPLRHAPLDRIGVAALAWTATVALSYVAHQQMLANGSWTIPPAILLLEYAPVYGLLVYDVARKAARQKTRPALSTI
jgi:alpha-1,6-mannosyltransferase